MTVCVLTCFNGDLDVMGAAVRVTAVMIKVMLTDAAGARAWCISCAFPPFHFILKEFECQCHCIARIHVFGYLPDPCSPYDLCHFISSLIAHP